MLDFEQGMEALQKRIDYRFRDPVLLQKALTHTTYAHEVSGCAHNQRLEFLGDAVLQLTVSHRLFLLYRNANEGELSKMRAFVVSEPSLAAAAKRISLGSYLRLGRGEEKCGGREKPSVLADGYEAVIGAIYLDGGFEAARDYVYRELDDEIQRAPAMKCAMDFKTRLQEKLQEQGRKVCYRLIGDEGPEHDKVFTVTAVVDGQDMASGKGRSKKCAEQNAAKAALEILNQPKKV